MKKRSPLWLIPNLTSLDAPFVALVWMWLMAHGKKVQYLDTMIYGVLAFSVWGVYVVDRLLDVRRDPSLLDAEDSPRHAFHWRNRKWLVPAVGVAFFTSLYYAFFVLPQNMLTVGFTGLVLVLFFGFAAKVDRSEVAYFKNLIAGLTFAFGVCAPVVVSSEQLPLVLNDALAPLGAEGFSLVGVIQAAFNFFLVVVLTVRTVLFSPAVMLFALLCTMNINAIDLWERARRSTDVEVKQESELALSLGLIMMVAASVFILSWNHTEVDAIVAYVAMASAAMLHFLNRKRYKFTLSALRVLADLAIVLPIPIVLMFR
ncbi:hypothetical protein [Rubritalea marina]|uniref:hypothetical protein n=1 Tax=Rubritalea marina TaxID=361055 RepID=UPI0003643E5F|nr:hypothetical protein [Rubritalea marina]